MARGWESKAVEAPQDDARRAGSQEAQAHARTSQPSRPDIA